MKTEKKITDKIQELLKKGRATIDTADLSNIDKMREVNDTMKGINSKVEALMWVQEKLEDL